MKLFKLMRTLLGLLFIFSGFVKCIDPTGGAIKIEDYFVAWGMDFVPFSISMSLSIIQNIAEFIIGFMLLTNVFCHIASWGALLFMAFFTPLTLYIALANPVSDCGCFGDAVKLTNWQTFGKNVIFLAVAIYVFWYSGKNKKSTISVRSVATVSLGLLVAIVVTIKGLTDEPIIDFRPYSVGTDIKQAMQIPDDAPLPKYETTFVLEKDGVEQVFDENNYPYNDSTWHYVDTHTVVIDEGFVPPIKDFTLTTPDGDMMTDYILSSADPVILAISPSLSDISEQHYETLRAISEAQEAIGREMFIMTSSSQSDQNILSQSAKYDFAYLMADETMLKTITRSNPGIFILQHGVVIGKYHINHLPMQGLSNPLATNLTNIESERSRLIILSTIFAVGLILLIIRKKKRNTYINNINEK